MKQIFPKDINGVTVKLGDKIKGFGFISFQDGFKIDKTPIVTVTKDEKGNLYFGQLSAKSFNRFEILKTFDLQKQFVLRNDKKDKTFYFDAQTNETNSYSVQYFECDANEINAWIILSKAIKKDRPNLILN